MHVEGLIARNARIHHPDGMGSLAVGEKPRYTLFFAVVVKQVLASVAIQLVFHLSRRIVMDSNGLDGICRADL